MKTINLIRGRALNHHLFKLLCQDFGSEHLVLLFHAEVCWLSRGRALTCFFEWREVKALLKECDYNLPKEMESQEFNQMLAYLSDVFTRKNVSMQGKSINILKCREKLNAFKEKLHIWYRRVKRGNFSNFFPLEEMVSVQFSFISAPPHEHNNKMLKSLYVVKDGVRKRKKQQNELTLCLAN